MAYTYAYKPKIKSRSEVGYRRSRRRDQEEERRLLYDDEENLWDVPPGRSSVLSSSSRGGGYGTMPSRATTFTKKAKTLLSAGDGMRADLTFEDISVFSVPPAKRRWLWEKPAVEDPQPMQLLKSGEFLY